MGRVLGPTRQAVYRRYAGAALSKQPLGRDGLTWLDLLHAERRRIGRHLAMDESDDAVAW
jgi:hypothetical protein